LTGCVAHRKVVPVRLLVAIALLFSVTPGVSEVVEAAVHLVAHADLPHHESERDRSCSEHGCTPLAHHCSCHATMSAQAASRAVSTQHILGIRKLDPSTFLIAAGRAFEPPPLRPPIA
jgi:hypothetical protein